MKDNPKLTLKGSRRKVKDLGKVMSEAVAACAIWEAMIENNSGFMKKAFADHGTCYMRERAVDLAPLFEHVWEALPEDIRDGWTWDWEFVPFLLEYLDWSEGEITEPVELEDFATQVLRDRLAAMANKAII